MDFETWISFSGFEFRNTMKLTCLQENLSRGLSTVCRVVSTTGSLPVLSNVLLQADGERLKLQATDLETGVTTWVGAKIEDEGSITVPAKIFSRLVSNLSPGEVSLEVEKQLLHLSAPDVESEFSGISAEEFPELPRFSDESSFTLQASELKDCIEKVVFAAARDDGRPILTGILFEVLDKKLTLVGLDGFRLAETVLRFEEDLPEANLVIPAKTLRELALILGKGENQVQVQHLQGENQILFKVGDVCFASRLLEGDFPEYKVIIPSGFTTQFKVLREDFLHAVQLASLFADGGAGIVRLEIFPQDGLISVFANTPEVCSNKVDVRGEGEGEDAKIAFNAKYLTDCLSAISSERVVFEMTEGLKPGAVRPDGSEDSFYVVMPVRVQE